MGWAIRKAVSKAEAGVPRRRRPERIGPAWAGPKANPPAKPQSPAAKAEARDAQTVGGRDEQILTLDGFMRLFCVKTERTLRRYRRESLLAAARYGTVEMPVPTESPKRGKAYEYAVPDLLAAWPGFLDAGIELPELVVGEVAEGGKPKE